MKPLTGVRIVSVEQFGAAPYGSMFLADLGAEVIKVENVATGGDPARRTGPFFLGEADSEYFQTWNMNKKSVALDLRRDEGKEALRRLAMSAEVVMNNLRGDLPAKMGLDYAAMSKVKKSLVCVHLSAYGRDNERASWPGYDYLMQAEAGWLSVTGEPDGPPARMGLSVVDYATGITCALALLAGILEARRSGKGRDLDVSLYDTAMHQLSYPGAWYLNEGLVTGRAPRSAHPYIAPSQLFRTRDGWIFIMAQTQRFWDLLCTKLGRPELSADPDFLDMAARKKNRDRLTEVLDLEFGKRTTAEWLEILRGTVPCGPVYDMRQALENPYFLERGGVQVLDHPQRAGFKLLASPIRTGEPLPARPAPKLGEHTDALLREIGYDAAQIARLKASGAV